MRVYFGGWGFRSFRPTPGIVLRGEGRWLSVSIRRHELTAGIKKIFRVLNFIVAVLTDVFQVVVIECDHWIIYVFRCQPAFVMDDLARTLAALLAQSTVDHNSLCYV